MNVAGTISMVSNNGTYWIVEGTLKQRFHYRIDELALSMSAHFKQLQWVDFLAYKRIFLCVMFFAKFLFNDDMY